MRKKLVSLIAILLCLSFATTACGDSKQGGGFGKTTEKDASQSKLDVLRPTAYSSVEGLTVEPGSYISIIGRYSDDSYWKELENGAKQAVADLNTALKYKGEDKIKLSYISPEVRDDINEQVNLLDEELGRYPIAIAIAAIDTTACSIQFDSASENGIPIITFDSGSDYKNVATHVSTDNLEATKTVAAKLAYEIGEEGEVAVIVQDSVSMTAKQRLQGFLETMETDFPNISVVHTYHMDQFDEMRKTITTEKNATLEEGQDEILPEDITQEDVIEYILEKNPNLKGIYATNLDTTQLVADVLTDLERTDLVFMGFDGGEEQIELLESELLNGIIVQNPYAIGYATVVAAARVSLGLGNESFVNSGYTWVTKDNLNKDDIKKMLY